MKETSVLHIWNVAGVSSILAKYQNRLFGWKTWVIMRKEFDQFITTVYGELCSCGRARFYLKSILASRLYNIIHIHYIDKILPWLRRIYRRKCLVMHYHGSDIRGKWELKRRLWSKADLVIVSTQDLFTEAPSSERNKKIFHLPNPVDTELFKPMPNLRRKGKALFIYSSRRPKLRESLEWAKKIAKQNSLSLEILDIDRNPIRYIDMPRLLNRYEYFIDHCYVPALSKTALEALACGLKVIRWDGRVIEGLPEQHKPENVVKKLKEYYERACPEIFSKVLA